jgi:uncharacterized protein YbaP (TraB family)
MRARLGSRLLCLSLQLWIIAPSYAEDGQPVVHATPAMWTVHGSKGTVYLLGSVHALPENIEWQTPDIRAAIRHSSTFVFEVPMQIDARERASRLLGDNMLLPSNTSLPAYFDSEMRSEFRDAVEHTQVTPEFLVRLRPWYAAKLLTGAMTRGPTLFADEGVDNKIAAIARDRGASFRALETDEFQLHMLMGSATPTNELAMLRTAMKQASNMRMTPFNKLLTAWETGDIAATAATGPDIMAPAERKIVLDDRNSAWVPQIEKMLNERRVFFITVGAAHLVGPLGVPEQLRAAGYQVNGPAIQGKTTVTAAELRPVSLKFRSSINN